MTSPDEPSQLARSLVAIKKLRARLDSIERARTEPIAIVGIGCRFPGGVTSPDGFWKMMVDGVDAVSQVTPPRWSVDDAASETDPADPDVGARFGAFVDDVDQFDPEFFGISPREARHMDPQQRMLLETTVEAIERAGLRVEDLTGSTTGVFVGAHSHSNDYGWLQYQSADLDAYSTTGTAHSILANRLSYFFDWKGPSLTVDTACSSSLVSTHLALNSLRRGECDVALAAGVNLILARETSLAMAKLQALAPDGRCKTFDARADGFVRGEGCAVVILKRLSDAESAGDPVLALLKGSAVNQDGSTNGLTAPNGLLQQAVVTQALADGHVDPATISYVEAHGTGTILGDPIEVEALTEVLGRAGDLPCALGSVKTNIGHLEGAAGIAGLVKVVLAMQHRALPPHLHFTKLNPHLSLAGTRFVIPAGGAPWDAHGEARRAGVSSFGIGGTNAHLVLEEAPNLTSDDRNRQPITHALLPLSARTDEGLRQHAINVAEFLRRSAAPLEDVCATAAQRRDHHRCRLAVVGRSHDELADRLTDFALGEPHDAVAVGVANDDPAPAVFVFAGQGPELVGLGRDLLEHEPVFREAIGDCDRALRHQADWSLMAALAPDAPMSQVEGNDVAQVVIVAVQIALARLWQSWGIRPSATIGHSVGEIAAAHAAGAIDLETAIRVAVHRGKILTDASGLGRMATVGLSGDDAQLLVADEPRVSVAVVNGGDSTVLSGDHDALEKILADLNSRDIFGRLLAAVDYPSHSVLMEPFAERMTSSLTDLAAHAPTLPMYSTSLGRWATASDFDARYWGRNIREPVLFAQGIEQLVADGFGTFVEISHHPMLQSSIEQIAGPDAVVTDSLRRNQPETAHVLGSLGRLFTRGVDIAWSEMYRRGQVVDLPTSPWQKQRYWLDEQQGSVALTGTPARNLILGVRLASPLPSFAVEFDLDRFPFLGDHRVDDAILVPSSALVTMALAGAEESLDGDGWAVTNLAIEHPLILSDTAGTLVQLVVSTGGADTRFQIFSRSHDEWIEHATGNFEPALSTDVAAEPIDLDAVRARCVDADIGDHFELLARNGLTLGPSFQGITKLWQGDHEALAEVRLPIGDLDEHGRSVVLIDACLQAMVTAVGGDDLHLLVGLDRFRISHWPDVVVSHARIKTPAAAAPGQTVIADVRFHDIDGSVLGEALGVVLRHVDRGTIRRLSGRQDQSESWLYDIAWEVQQADLPQLTGASAGRWIVFVDSNGVGSELVRRLRDKDHDVVVVRPGSEYARSGTDVVLDPLDPAHFDHLGSAVDVAGRSVAYLWGLDASMDDDGPVRSTAGAMHVARLLAGADHGRHEPPGKVWIATQQAQSLSGEATQPASAALWGLGRVIALEFPAVWGGLIDLDDLGGDSDEAVSQLLSDITLAGHEDQIAWRGGRRHVARLRPAAPPPASTTAPWSDGSALITGGLGGLGLKLAEWLIGRGVHDIVLTGRTPLPPRTEWGRLEQDTGLAPEQAGRVAAILEMERSGATVTPVALDVADDVAMSELFSRFGEDLPPLRHVFHLAAAVDHTPLDSMSVADIRRMFRAKVDGGWLLHRLSTGVDLDTFVLFSSTTALWGVTDMAHYAAANAFLDSLAHHRRASGQPALSVNWGTWSEMRIMSEADREEIAGFGLRPMEVDRALDLLDRLVVADVVQRTVADVDWQLLKPAYETRRVRDLLRDIDIASQTGVGRSTTPALAAALEAAEPHERPGLLTRHVTAEVAKILGYEYGHVELDVHQGLFDLGLDSLMAVELRQRLERATAHSLPSTLIFNHPSVAALSEFLAAELLDATQDDASSDAASADPDSDSRRPGPARSTTTSTPDDDLLAMFDQEIGQIDDLLGG